MTLISGLTCVCFDFFCFQWMMSLPCDHHKWITVARALWLLNQKNDWNFLKIFTASIVTSRLTFCVLKAVFKELNR